MKPIYFSQHALARMLARGATAEEVTAAIEETQWQPAQQGRYEVHKTFPFGQLSPVNQQVYAFKTIHAIFVEEPSRIVVITVLVYYGN
jgi:hypothetical protein